MKTKKEVFEFHKGTFNIYIGELHSYYRRENIGEIDHRIKALSIWLDAVLDEARVCEAKEKKKI
jgi:hypothetical protein